MSRQARAAGTQTGRSAPTPRKEGIHSVTAKETDWSAGACVKRRKVEREDRAARSIPRRPEKSYVATPQRIRSGGETWRPTDGRSAAKVVGVRVSRRYTGYLLFLPFSARDLQRLRIRLTDSLRDESSGERGRDIK